MPRYEVGLAPSVTGQTVTRLTIRRPDDWHVHLRDGAHNRSLQRTCTAVSAHFHTFISRLEYLSRRPLCP